MQQIITIEKDLTNTFKSSGFFTGNRIPADYFETSGTGESDIAIHAGSYHLALKAARIERYNIMTYSSILPGIANRVERPAMATHGEKGQQATAGIIYSWLYARNDNTRYGGLVCEHEGNYDLHELERRLKASLEELYQNGFAEQYVLGEPRILSESFIPRKAYGTALTALCFTSYYHPVINA